MSIVSPIVSFILQRWRKEQLKGKIKHIQGRNKIYIYISVNESN